MPANLIPLAIVAVKIGASAVVSLAPVGMSSREETEHGQGNDDDNNNNGDERVRFRDFFKKEFYAKEFARLEKERLHHDHEYDTDEPTIPVSRPCHKKREEEGASSLRNENGLPMRIPGAGAFHAREFEPLRNERSLSMRRLRR